MGIVSSTFASLAIQFAWNCQRLLDPQYRCVEGKRTVEISPPPINRVQSPGPNVVKVPSTIHENNNSVHQENRNRRATQLRYRKRPSSFDTVLIANRKDNLRRVNLTCVATSTPSPLRRPPPPIWDVSSTSGCSSNSSSDLDSDSGMDFGEKESMLGHFSDLEEDREFDIGAAEALRLTVGRGHFSRTKKDKFLNHLRLEKRLNDLNNDFHRVTYGFHPRRLRRCQSGDLHRVV